MTIYDLTVDQGINLVDICGNDTDPEFYGSIADGNLFFSRRLRAQDWEGATLANKRKALYQSTKLIDNLNFIGEKTDETQKLQFPRGGDTEVPPRIVEATYLIAAKLLSGKFDPDLELGESRLTRSRFGSQVEIEQDAIAHPHIMSGIPTVEAWRLLAPYLVNYTAIQLIRE